MTRWKLTLEYDGTDYAGWQRQDNVSSVQQAVEDAIAAFCPGEERIVLHVAGRTDAGVHALGQVAHADIPREGMDGTAIMNAINAHLRPQPVSIIKAEAVADDFHARFAAINKLYRYRILNRTAPPALERHYVWHVRRELDETAMHAAAQYLTGHHDFTTFRDSECQAKSPEKTLDRLDVRRQAHEIVIEAEGRSFLHHQVRNMVGTLALVGEGRWRADDVKTALAARDRTKGGPTAPAEGLYLVRVDY